MKSFSQKYLRADEAINHIGEIITVEDSAYSGKLFKDSIVVLNLGKKKIVSPLTIILLIRPKLGTEKQLLKIYQSSKILVSGLVLDTQGGPTIIVDNYRYVKFGTHPF